MNLQLSCCREFPTHGASLGQLSAAVGRKQDAFAMPYHEIRFANLAAAVW
ncbi:hypothetical protein [Mucilaginibacter gilvus]|nr:hypothetical protein [Mucilaginibacter gilvus]